MIRLSIFLLLIIIFNSIKVYAKDIPIIVISAGKSPQSKSVVGSDVSIINEDTISNSGENFVGDILSENLMGMNYFQSGGFGTVSGIQLRGQPKRYSTVYLNGIKLSDPSTPSNDYYFGNLVNNSLESVEILKGSQSTLYGSGAIAGTINLYSKKGKAGNHKSGNVSVDTFGPLGPYLVTKDEIQDVNNLNLSLDVNGSRHQTGNTNQMIFNFNFLVAHITSFITLMPGDIVTTGTPPGVGLGMNPPVFLKKGDQMNLSVDNLGTQNIKLIAE